MRLGEGTRTRLPCNSEWEGEVEEVAGRSSQSASGGDASRLEQQAGHVFHKNGEPLVESLLGQQQARVRERLKMPKDFVLPLRHTFGTRLGESGCDAFGIMRLMGRSSVIVSQRYVHPSPAAIEREFGRMIGDNVQEVPTVAESLLEVVQ